MSVWKGRGPEKGRVRSSAASEVYRRRLLQHLREFGLKGRALEVAQCDTIRLKLLKIGALVRVTVRRVLIFRSSSYPYAALFQQVLANIRARAPCPSC